MTRPVKSCPGVRICCPTCGGVVRYAEISDGEGFFRCQHEPEGVKCRQHFYAACTAYLCTVIAITKEERDAMRWMSGASERLAWLGPNVAREPGTARAA